MEFENFRTAGEKAIINDYERVVLHLRTKISKLERDKEELTAKFNAYKSETGNKVPLCKGKIIAKFQLQEKALIARNRTIHSITCELKFLQARVKQVCGVEKYIELMQHFENPRILKEEDKKRLRESHNLK